jgi:hypothetical protein
VRRQEGDAINANKGPALVMHDWLIGIIGMQGSTHTIAMIRKQQVFEGQHLAFILAIEFCMEGWQPVPGHRRPLMVSIVIAEVQHQQV